MHQRTQSIPVVRTAESQVQSLVRDLGSQKPCSGSKKKKKKKDTICLLPFLACTLTCWGGFILVLFLCLKSCVRSPERVSDDASKCVSHCGKQCKHFRGRFPWLSVVKIGIRDMSELQHEFPWENPWREIWGSGALCYDPWNLRGSEWGRSW